jgi:hypothetical protein
VIARSLARRRLGGGEAPSAPPPRTPIHLYSTGPVPAELPPEVELWPGSGDLLVAATGWDEVLARVRSEQCGSDRLKVAVYPCASIQVLDKELK